MTHVQALWAAIADGYTHGNSIYSYHAPDLTSFLREAEREADERTSWDYQRNSDGSADIWNASDSEAHHCWKVPA